MRACAIGFVCTDVYEEQGISYPTGNGVDFVINLQRLGIPGGVVTGFGKVLAYYDTRNAKGKGPAL